MKEIFGRISVRKFENRQVESDKCEKLLRAAMAAPSAGNEMPWEFVVVRNKEILHKLSKCSPYAKPAADAAMVIVVLGNDKNYKFQECVIQDLSAATENILLEAVHLGLGGVWLGIAPLEERMEAVSNVLNLSDNLHPFALVALGYPDVEIKKENRFDKSRIQYM